MIEVQKLTKKYGNKTAVSDLNFTLEEGHIYGFLGPNGAGKSTVMNILTGALAATEGSVTIDGHDILDQTLAAKQRVGYLPENPPLYAELTPREYLHFIGSAKRISDSDLSTAVKKAMNETGLREVENRLISSLSKGYRQRVGIAQAILGEPKYVILDEPTVGLDPKQVVEIRKLISSVGKQRTVILSSHILSEIAEVCDRILILSEGKLRADDTLAGLQRQYLTSHLLLLTVKAPPTKVRDILSSISGINRLETHPLENGCEVEISFTRNRDIREAVFFAFSSAHCAILSMQLREMTLEDIFLQATDSNSQSRKESEKKKEKKPTKENSPIILSPKPSPEKSKPESIKLSEEEEADGEEYRPLFSRKDKKE